MTLFVEALRKLWPRDTTRYSLPREARDPLLRYYAKRKIRKSALNHAQYKSSVELICRRFRPRKREIYRICERKELLYLLTNLKALEFTCERMKWKHFNIWKVVVMEYEWPK